MRITDIDRIVFEWVLNALWQIGILALVAMVLQPLVRNASAHLRHCYWVAASALCVLIPALSLVFLGLPERMESAMFLTQTYAGLPSTALSPLIEPPSIVVPKSLPQYAVWAYLGCLGLALFGLGRSILTVSAFRKEAEAGRTVPRLDDTVARCAAAFKVSGVRAFASDNIHSPMTIGFRKPLILVPSEIVQTGDSSTLVAIVGHEMAHIKRKDFLVNLLTQLLVVPVQFHPLIWCLIGKTRRQRELACDEMVTAALISKRVYARRLLEVAAESIKGGRMRPQLAFGTDSLEERIIALMAPSTRVSSRWVQRAIVILACAFLLVAGAGTGVVFVRAQDRSEPAGQEQGSANSEDKVREASDPGVVLPKIITQTIPSYTEEARSAGVEGAVVIECIIRTTGRVTDSRVVQSLGSGLDEVTIKEIEDNWRFSPATIEGEPVNLRAEIEVTFNLRDGEDAESPPEAKH